MVRYPQRSEGGANGRAGLMGEGAAEAMREIKGRLCDSMRIGLNA